MRQIVFPIVVRTNCNRDDILAFRHPLAGLQLVKGGVELGETPDQAAVRELREESGVHCRAAHLLETVPADDSGPMWHLVLCETAPLPAHWIHRCLDDGGHDFAFFWHKLSSQLTYEWHPTFHKAMAYVRARLL